MLIFLVAVAVLWALYDAAPKKLVDEWYWP